MHLSPSASRTVAAPRPAAVAAALPGASSANGPGPGPGPGHLATPPALAAVPPAPRRGVGTVPIYGPDVRWWRPHTQHAADAPRLEASGSWRLEGSQADCDPSGNQRCRCICTHRDDPALPTVGFNTYAEPFPEGCIGICDPAFCQGNRAYLVGGTGGDATVALVSVPGGPLRSWRLEAGRARFARAGAWTFAEVGRGVGIDLGGGVTLEVRRHTTGALHFVRRGP